MDAADATLTPSNPGTNPVKLQFLLKRDTFVEPTTNTQDFAFVNSRGPIEGPPETPGGRRPGELDRSSSLDWRDVYFQFAPRAGREALFTCPGNVTIGAMVLADKPRDTDGAFVADAPPRSGSITARKIKVVGGTDAESLTVEEGSSGVNFYSQTSIDINTYLPTRDHSSGNGGYWNLDLKGVLYAWGDIRLKLGPRPDESQLELYRRSGFLTLRGAVVAYGANPGAADNPAPGTGLSGGQTGLVSIQAGTISLRQDSAYVSTTQDRAIPESLEVVSWSIR